MSNLNLEASIEIRCLESISKLSEISPGSTALSWGGRQLSFGELDSRADHFAGYLVEMGVAAGGTVAICLPRSFDWIIAALGSMRAGAAYVPLDPAWPDSRLAYAVKDSSATVLIAPSVLQHRLKLGVHGVDPARDGSAIGAAPKLERRTLQPDSCAYVIYTSGSTGVPKGVEITHANLENLIRWHVEAFQVTPRDRASHFAGLGFDAAAWEVWANLSAGATLCLADDEVRTSPVLMQEWIVHEQITIAFVPTVHAGPLMAMEWPANTQLRLLLTGGETLHHGPGASLPFQVVNNYGPSECAVVATSALLEPGAGGLPPIGRPIQGAALYLLGENLEPVSDGAVGEIYVGGNGVGRGYRNLPELTALNFLADPFVDTPGARMYRTGDRGVRRADGQVEFRGRLDRQAKIRGFRIELDEIGSVLEDDPRVEFATVITRPSQAGETQLVAYVLPKETTTAPTAHELQEHLLKRLPEYMVPAVFVKLRARPLSPNGKIDLSLLDQSTDGQVLERVAAQASTSPTEAKLLGIVRGLLQNDGISAADNFFLAGGHSLLGMQLLMRLSEEFSVSLSLRQLFEAPTAERLAALIELVVKQNKLTAIWEDLLGKKRLGLDDNFFELGGKAELLASVQQRIATEFGQQLPINKLLQCPTIRQQAELMTSIAEEHTVLPPGVLALQPKGTRNTIFWIHYFSVGLAKLVGEDQPFLVVRLMAEDLASLGAKPTLEKIAACHARKIVSTQPQGPYIIGGFCLGGILSFEIAQQLREAGHEVSLLVMLDPPSPSHLADPTSLSPRLGQLPYLLKQASRLGVRSSAAKLFRHLRGSEVSRSTESAKTEVDVVQEMIEAAAAVYKPRHYEGRVLLVLAAERPPHLDFLPDWQALVPRNLHTEYLDGQHNDLTKGKNVQQVAETIFAHLPAAGVRVQSDLAQTDLTMTGST
jgi:amino acid adenylation domain-containing protein